MSLHGTVHGARCMVQGARCKVHGTWCMVHGGGIYGAPTRVFRTAHHQCCRRAPHGSCEACSAWPGTQPRSPLIIIKINGLEPLQILAPSCFAPKKNTKKNAGAMLQCMPCFFFGSTGRVCSASPPVPAARRGRQGRTSSGHPWQRGGCMCGRRWDTSSPSCLRQLEKTRAYQRVVSV